MINRSDQGSRRRNNVDLTGCVTEVHASEGSPRLVVAGTCPYNLLGRNMTPPRNTGRATPSIDRCREVATSIGHRHSAEPELDEPVVKALRWCFCDQTNRLVSAVVLYAYCSRHRPGGNAILSQPETGYTAHDGSSGLVQLMNSGGRLSLKVCMVVKLVWLHAHIITSSSPVCTDKPPSNQVLLTWHAQGVEDRPRVRGLDMPHSATQLRCIPDRSP